QLVGPGADRDVGEPAPGTPVLGVEGVGHHGELADVLDGRTVLLNPAPHVAHAAGRAVDEDLGVPRVGAVDARAPGRVPVDAGEVAQERSDIAFAPDRDQRQLLDELRGEPRRERRARSIQERRLARDLHGLADGPDLEHRATRGRAWAWAGTGLRPGVREAGRRAAVP